MSVDNLLFSEEFYYLRDTDYRQGIKEVLKERRLRVRRPSLHAEHIGGMTLFTAVMGRVRGHAPSRVGRGIKWRKRLIRERMEKMYNHA